jgi:hypothetical protein
LGDEQGLVPLASSAYHSRLELNLCETASEGHSLPSSLVSSSVSYTALIMPTHDQSSNAGQLKTLPGSQVAPSFFPLFYFNQRINLPTSSI